MLIFILVIYCNLSNCENLQRNIVDGLSGIIGDEYAQIKENITFTDGEIIDIPENENDKDEKDNPSEENKYYSFVKFLITVILAILSWLL